MRSRRGPVALMFALALALPLSGSARAVRSPADSRTGILGAFSEVVDRLEGMLLDPASTSTFEVPRPALSVPFRNCHPARQVGQGYVEPAVRAEVHH
jgi:hypothetical protein